MQPATLAVILKTSRQRRVRHFDVQHDDSGTEAAESDSGADAVISFSVGPPLFAVQGRGELFRRRSEVSGSSGNGVPGRVSRRSQTTRKASFSCTPT